MRWANWLLLEQVTHLRRLYPQDASVRKTLLSFLEWLLPPIPRVGRIPLLRTYCPITGRIIQAKLLPHASLLLLFTTSALSHIFPEIRIDAVKFLDLLLDLVPDLAAGGWVGEEGEDLTGSKSANLGIGDPSSSNSADGQRVLDGYLSLLSLKGRQGGKSSHLRTSLLVYLNFV
jgi:pre-rRNA-processing protein IPI1